MNANERRLASLEQKTEENERRKAQISLALNSLDSSSGSGTTGKNLKFASDTSDDEELKPSTSKTTSSSQAAENKPKLFQDDSDEGDGSASLSNDAEEDFNFEKPQFHGKKGQKLMKLQATFNGDARFKMDERFTASKRNRNSSNQHDQEEQIKEEESPEKKEMQAEKQAEREILEKVLGCPILPSGPDPNDKISANRRRGMVRFDPTKPDHYKYERKADDPQTSASESSSSSSSESDQEEEEYDKPKTAQKSSLTKNKTKEEELVDRHLNGKEDMNNLEEKNDNDKRTVVSKTSPSKGKKSIVQMDTGFADQIRQKLLAKNSETDTKEKADEADEQPFSLLASLGRSVAPSSATKSFQTRNESDQDGVNNGYDQLNGSKRLEPFLDDDYVGFGKFDDESDDEEPKKKKQKKTKKSAKNDEQKEKLSFFFREATDERLVEAVNKFCRTEPMDRVVAKWNKFRPSLVKTYKKARKNALKNAKKKLYSGHGAPPHSEKRNENPLAST